MEAFFAQTDAEIGAIARETAAAASELLQSAGTLNPGQIFVVGCSTSEIRGSRIGSSGSEEVAGAVWQGLYSAVADTGLLLAVQCCEHLNRALVVERMTMERYGLEEVAVVPMPHAGGSLAAEAFRRMSDPVVVESIAAHLGLDIGLTLIGMHLRRVAVPVRLQQCRIGQALLTAARTRPKLIGGARAVYDRPEPSAHT